MALWSYCTPRYGRDHSQKWKRSCEPKDAGCHSQVPMRVGRSPICVHEKRPFSIPYRGPFRQQGGQHDAPSFSEEACFDEF